MTPDEILKAVNEMTPEQLTAKVAELKGWPIIPFESTQSPDDMPKTCTHLTAHCDGRLCLRTRETNDWNDRFPWSPPTKWGDAGPLWEEMDQPGVDAMIEPLPDGHHVLWDEVYGEHDFGVIGPLAITKTWVWWKWCEKEGADAT